jgi:hypothetical protein
VTLPPAEDPSFDLVAMELLAMLEVAAKAGSGSTARCLVTNADGPW